MCLLLDVIKKRGLSLHMTIRAAIWKKNLLPVFILNEKRKDLIELYEKNINTHGFYRKSLF